MKKGKLLIQILMMVAALFLLNLLAERFSMRLDLTEEGIYTLSKASKDIIRSLDEPVTVTAYFTKGSQPEVDKVRQDFLDLLTEYANLSDGMINFAFVNPNKEQELENEAMQNGIQPLMLNVREKDQVKQQRVFLGAQLKMGDREEVIPVIQPGAAMEYTLSSTIKKLSVVNKPKIGFVQGQGGPSLNALVQANQQLGVLYQTEAIDLSDESISLADYKTLAIVAPADSFPSLAFNRLDAYLKQGGSVYVAYDQAEADFQTMMGNIHQGNLPAWLASKGLTVDKNFVVDANAGTIGVQQQSGFMTFSRQIPFHYWPSITKFEEHPATRGLNQVILQFASSIRFTGDTSMLFTPLVKTSEQSGTLAAPAFINLGKDWTKNDFPLKGQTVGALLEGHFGGSNTARIFLITDGEFAVNGEGREMQQRQPDNVSLMVNVIDYLSDDTGLIELRTKEITSRPLEALEDGERNFLKWLNFLLPISLVIVFGIARLQWRRNIRKIRMEVGHV
jgi:gliding-associated putative ABC transporter substrate-binding component GldG